MFRRPFQNRLGLNLATGLGLLAVFSVLRMVIVLQANATQSYAWVSAFFVIMILTPFAMLNRLGLRRIGWRRPKGFGLLILAIVLGIGCCAAMIYSADALFGAGDDNAFVYIARAYASLPSPMDDRTRLIVFAVFALIAMTLSPIGEEVFYRGMIHEALVGTQGEPRASVVDAMAFALVHLSHFGLIWSATGWLFLSGPALWWVSGLFLTGLAFAWARRFTHSIVGAILAHAGFNLAMTAWIFFRVL